MTSPVIMGEDELRVRDLELALDLALRGLIRYEPGDSRAVSDEFVAMGAILCGLNDNMDECRSIIRNAIAEDNARLAGEDLGMNTRALTKVEDDD